MRLRNFRRRDDHSWQTIGTSSSGIPRRTLKVMRCCRRKEGISADTTGASIDDNRAAVFQRRGQRRGRAGSRFAFPVLYMVFHCVCTTVPAPGRLFRFFRSLNPPLPSERGERFPRKLDKGEVKTVRIDGIFPLWAETK